MEECYRVEFEALNDFYKTFGSNIDSTDSVLIYQHQCLHHSKLADITNFHEQKLKYYTNAEEIITKNYALELFLKTARKKYKLGVSLECFLPNHKYLRQTQADRLQLLVKTIYSAKNYIASFKNDADFDYQKAQTMLDNFRDDIADDLVTKDLYSAEECHEIMDEEIQLGFFYQTTKFNGKDCNYSVYVAKDVAKNKNEDVSLYVQKNIGLHPQGNSLMNQDLYYKIEKADSLIEKLKIIKANVPDNFIDFAVQSLHINTEKFYVKGIEFPNPNLELNQWLLDNVSPATRAYLEEQTLTYKSRSANKRPQSHVIIDIDDEDKVSDQQSQSFIEDANEVTQSTDPQSQSSNKGPNEIAQGTEQPSDEQIEQYFEEKTDQFDLHLGSFSVKPAKNATINFNIGGDEQNYATMNFNLRDDEQAADDAQQLQNTDDDAKKKSQAAEDVQQPQSTEQGDVQNIQQQGAQRGRRRAQPRDSAFENDAEQPSTESSQQRAAQRAEQRAAQAAELTPNQSDDELPSAPPLPPSGSELRRSKSDELPSAPPLPPSGSELRRSKSHELPSAPSHPYQRAKQSDEQADKQGIEQAA